MRLFFSAERKSVEEGILVVVLGVEEWKDWNLDWDEVVSEFGRRRVTGRDGVIYLPTLRSGAECLSNKLAISCHAAARKRQPRNDQSGICIFPAWKKLYLFLGTEKGGLIGQWGMRFRKARSRWGSEFLSGRDILVV